MCQCITNHEVYRGGRDVQQLRYLSLCMASRAVEFEREARSLGQLVQRTDAREVTIAGDIDPTYAAAVRSALEAGVEPLGDGCRITPGGVTLGKRLPFTLPWA